jgi:CubicO group peptidase (beta-lactamase class C family)
MTPTTAAPTMELPRNIGTPAEGTDPMTETTVERDEKDVATQDFSIPGSATTKLDAAHWRSRLTELIAQYHVPGAALGILRDGEITDFAAGVLSLDTGFRATPDTIFQIGSISKVWTATLIMQLVDEGALDLDAPVRDVLPDFAVADPEVSATVTTRHLLTHTSGIDGDVFDDTGRGDDAVAKYVGALATVAQNHPLGVTFSYCNSGYVTLGAIVEKLTGMTWDRALVERICQPLGLTATVTLPEQMLLHPTAVGHVGGGDDGPVRQAPVALLPRAVGPAGLITARAHDVLCFARMHLAGGLTPDGRRVLSASSAEAMTQFQTEVPDPYTLGGDSWGLGWIRFAWGRDGDVRLFGHDGNTIGQSAFLRILPAAGFAVVLLTNGGNAKGLYHELYGELFAELAGVTIPEDFVPPENPPAVAVADWLGTYERASVRTEVLERDRELILRATGTGPLADLEGDPTKEYPMTAVREGLFAAFVKDVDSYLPITFYTIPDGTRYVHYGVRANPMVAPA